MFTRTVLSLLLASSAATSFAAGRQLTGVYAPAATAPLPPEEAAKKMTLPEGFEARIFAHEPQVVNPVAMTWDERGRLWVVELYEYPLGAAPGTKPRDNVKILEDTDNDGRADKVTVFADGLNLATGILIGYGGVFVGQAPHLYFMEDTNGDDVADKKTIVKTGFGLEDRHELLNGFTWGPDGYLYMTHGVFTHSKVKNPDDPNDDGVTMTAAVARFHPRTKKFEIFAEGTSNPWGVDFDRAGNAFVSACVIDHLFHMAPGGIYQRQAGSPPHPFAYELLPSIVDHKHFRAAYSGVQVYQGDQYPEEYKGTILMGNIHDSSVHQDKLTPAGATFKASFVRDFVRANDGWFRPVSVQGGPDGAVWIMDWYDKYPCYQNANADPEGVDRAHGRIWRIVYTGKDRGKPVGSRPDKGMNLAKLSNDDLAKVLEHPNAWHRRTAQRIFTERGEGTFGRSFHGSNPVLDLLDSDNADARLAALWTLHTMGELEEVRLEKTKADKDPAVRAWTARLIGERGYALPDSMKWLSELANDPEITVRAAVAVAARQFVSGSLTINTPPKIPLKEVVTGGALSGLWFSTKGEVDPTFTYLYWMAAEPLIAYDPLHALGFYQGNGAMKGGGGDQLYPFSSVILTKIMRRVCDMKDREILSEGLMMLKDVGEEHAPALAAALKGLIEGQKGNPLIPNTEAVQLVSKWSGYQHKETASLAQQLGTLWGDAAALTATLNVITDSNRAEQERVQAIDSVRQQKLPAVRDALVKTLNSDAPEAVLGAVVSGIAQFGTDDVADLLLKRWKQFTPSLRRTTAEVLSSRWNWAHRLLSNIESKAVAVSDVPAPVIRNLLTSKDDGIRNRATTVIGKFRESTPDKAKLIADKKAIVLSGPIDLKKGKEVAQRTCLTCHKLHNEGSEVGPDLTGVGRSSLDALLANVIDPNQLIGAGYENVEVTLKDDRTVAGRMIENSDARIRLLVLGGKEEVIAKSDIENLRVSELSVMPEGLEQMPDEDFRNLIWYILNPPQDDKPIFLHPGDKQLTVKTKIANNDFADLVTYVTDPSLRPYLHPVNDPSGKTTLTQDKPDDHPWQHGIFTGLHKVNGVDFWSEKEGKLQFKRLLDVIQEQDHVGWRALVEWVAPNGQVIVEEEQFVKVYAPTSPNGYNIDFDWTLRAKDKAVKIGKHEYGGFAVRMDFNGNPSHLNSNGERNKDTAEKRAGWANVSRHFGDKTYGIVVYDHPSNSSHPPMWRVDGQGLINPSPSLQGDWSIEPNRARTYHYRLSVHQGPGDAHSFNSEFKTFSAITFNQLASMHPDKESVALWNPEWKLNVPDFEDSPVKLPEFAGRRNVLMTHPFAKDKASAIERAVEVPAGKKTILTFNVASHDSGDWELRILANNEVIKKQIIDKKGDRWKTVSIDLTPYAGKKINLRLENAANDWNYEYAYWSELKLSSL
ncbi:MAG TPA: PVC-type heme-binding CxxCH protein [Verrucomicrobiae bacterium]